MWPNRDFRPRTTSSALTALRREVVILEGDNNLVSGINGSLGLRFDNDRNDLASVVQRFTTDVADQAGLLVLFTMFDDLGAAGPAYFVPFFNQVQGTGMGIIDQRSDFNTRALEGLVNLKHIDSHNPDELTAVLAEEVGHRHLAYMRLPRSVATSTQVTLVGRQEAHWHGLLHTGGSFMDGHDWLERSLGEFIVVSRNRRFSQLDLYGLGLLPPENVDSFFFIKNGTSLAGAQVPPAAQLPPGFVARGKRLDLTVDDVIQELGPRTPKPGAVTTTRLFFALLTEPGQSANVDKRVGGGG